MYKEVVFSTNARKQLLKGVTTLSQAVVATLGPSGRNVILEQIAGIPVSTKDGVTVAKSIELEDRVENLGAQLVKQASIRTAEQAGDGTTTSILLAKTLYEEAIASIKEDTNAVELKRGMDKMTSFVVEKLKEYSKEITDEEQLKQIATISANGDTQVGDLIFTAVDKVGRDGVVTVEESKTGETYLEVVEGIQFSRGFKSPYFVTDNKTMQAVLNDPFILIVDKKLNAVKEVLPILETVSHQNKSLLIIADDVEGETLSTLVVNKARGVLSCVAVKAPDFGDRKKAILEDIAVLTGGQVVSLERGMRLDKFDTAWLGRAKKVTVSKDTTIIVDALGEAEKIEERALEIKNQIENAVSPYEKEVLHDRLGKFIGGVAVLHIGGRTEIELKEKKDRVEDALHATKAALEEGILPGGGIALLNLARELEMELESLDFSHKDQKIGALIVLQACEEPFFQILGNAGYTIEDAEQICRDREEDNRWAGFDVRGELQVDMLKAGIIDPTKVVRLALENAVSVAGTMLTTEAVVSIKETKKEKEQDFDPEMINY